MKRLLNKSHLPLNLDAGILLIRIAVSILMLTHGLPKLMKFFADEPVAFANIMGLGAGVSLAIAILAEVVCSIFLMLGLATRPALIPLILTMAVAVLHIHAEDPLAVKEKAIIFLLVYVFLFFTGSGKYSLDNMLSKKRGNFARIR
ncbi:MAG: DoxX family protein [Ginsengibacter sp.]